MHKSAYDDAALFACKYCHPTDRVLDVGSQNINGCLRPLFEDYFGVDLAPGRNVDLVLKDQHHWPELAINYFDVVVSSQVMEHVRNPFKWMAALARHVRPGGLVYVCTPNSHQYHPYPIDCWRVYPDGMREVMLEAGLEIVECYMKGKDTTGIGRKPL